VAGELCVGGEAVDRADLAEQLGGAERAAAGELEQPRRECLRSRVQLSVQLHDRPRQRATAAEQVAGDPYLRGLLAAGELTAEPVQPDRAVECAERDAQCRVEFV